MNKVFILKEDVDTYDLHNRGRSGVRLSHDRAYAEKYLRDELGYENERLYEWFTPICSMPPDCKEIESILQLFDATKALKSWVVQGHLENDGVSFRFIIDCDISGMTAFGKSVIELVLPELKNLIEAALRLGSGEDLSVDLKSDKRQALIVLNRLSNWAESKIPKKTKRTGRRKKGETPGKLKVISALRCLLDKKDPVVDAPPNGKEISEYSGVANVSRFIREIFGGQKEFEAAWRRGDVREKLAKFEYDPNEKKHLKLREQDGASKDSESNLD